MKDLMGVIIGLLVAVFTAPVIGPLCLIAGIVVYGIVSGRVFHE